MGPSEGVWRRLPLPGWRITWLVTRSRDKVDHGRPALARLFVDRCLGTDPVLGTTQARALRGLCRLVGDCCQPGVSMGRPAAWAASSRRLSYVANERRRSCRSRSSPEVTFTLRQPAGGAAGHGPDQGSVGPVIAGH